MEYKNLKDVFFASKFHVGKGLVTYDKSLDPVVFDQLADMNAVANSEVAMNAVANSEVAMNAVLNSEVAMNAVGASNIAIGKLAVGLAGLNPEDYEDMNAVLNSEVAMNAVVNSEVAMNAVANSEVAMNAVANSEVAMNAVANSEVAMNAVVNSEVARFALTNSPYLQQNRNTIVNTLETGVSKGLFVKYSTVYINATGKYNSTSNWALDNTIEPDNSIAIIKAAGPYTDGINATTRIKHLQNPNVVVFERSGTVKLQSVDNYVCIGGLIHEETGDSYVRIDGYKAV